MALPRKDSREAFDDPRSRLRACMGKKGSVANELDDDIKSNRGPPEGSSFYRLQGPGSHRS